MNDHRSFPSMLRHRAATHPMRPAVVFIDDAGAEQVLSYGELWQRSLHVAKALGEAPQVLAAAGSQGQASPVSHAARALLLFPAGLDFLPALIGSQLAGWIPVPTGYPRPHRAMPQLDAAARDCQPAAILTDSRTIHSLDRTQLDPAAANLPCLAVDTACANGSAGPVSLDLAWHRAGNGSASAGSRPPGYPATAVGDPIPESLALLQYTSGSTSAPKGVMVSQRNLMTNLETIRTSFALDWQREDVPELSTAVFWLPHFHDMGLIGGMLAPLYLGFRTVLMSPQTFIRRPIRWLQAIDRYRAIVTGAPSFAFELCADRVTPVQAEGLDLSSLNVTFCGAEPIRAAALRGFATRFASAGFRKQSYYPCYGLAESTLLAAGGQGPGIPRLLELDRSALREGRIRVLGPEAPEKKTTLVSCGTAAGDAELVIVDPASGVLLQDDQIGELWLRGDSIASGYWNRPQENGTRFAATLSATRPGLGWRLFGKRSGRNGTAGAKVADLSDGKSQPGHGAHRRDQREQGFFRTGDLGFYHDGELFLTGRLKDVILIRGRNHFPQDIEATVGTLGDTSFGRVAAVSVEGPRGEALGVVAEIARQTSSEQFSAIVRQIRRGIIDEHEVDPRHVLLVRAATIPVTTSGKLKRSLCQQWLASGFRGSLHHWQRSGGAESPPLPLPVLPVSPGSHDFDALSETIRQWIVQWLTVRGGVEPEQIHSDRRFEDYGLDSLMAIELIGDLEDGCDVELTPSVAWEHPTIDKMATLVAARVCGVPEQPPAAVSACQVSGQATP